jgi:alpha-tubulin suppressor-like RCC1 family protein
VLKNGGEVYAWGEGGCGQLGIGECVKSRDKPVRCSTLGIQKRAKTKYGKPRTGGGGGKGRFSPFIDVSCGWAHVLARNADGEVYGEFSGSTLC